MLLIVCLYISRSSSKLLLIELERDFFLSGEPVLSCSLKLFFFTSSSAKFVTARVKLCFQKIKKSKSKGKADCSNRKIEIEKS